MSKIAIISPSGNLYGSEQVLNDYLKNTSLKADIFVPTNSSFFTKLKEQKLNHSILTYNNKRLLKFYSLLCLKIAIGKYRRIYLNEAGHSRYVILLSKVFKKKSFVIHVRMAEDTNKERWPRLPGSNVNTISISRFIQNLLPFSSHLLYDPYYFPVYETKNEERFKKGSTLAVGIIGRITMTKGLNRLLDILRAIESHSIKCNWKFLLFGDISEDALKSGLVHQLRLNKNVIFKGFVGEQHLIYSQLDCVLHLSTQEALGRIFLEAIDFEKPLIGMNAAGVGEIGHVLNLDHLLVDSSSENVTAVFLSKLEYVQNNYKACCDRIFRQKKAARDVFSLTSYTESIDKFLTQ